METILSVMTITDRRIDAEIGLGRVRSALGRRARAVNAALRCRLSGNGEAPDDLTSADDALLQAEKSVAREEAALRGLGWDGSRPRLSASAYLTASAFTILAGCLFMALTLSAGAGLADGQSVPSGILEATLMLLGLLVHAAFLGHLAGRGVTGFAGERGRAAGGLAILASTAQAAVLAAAVLALFGMPAAAAALATALSVSGLSFLRHRPGPHLTDRIDRLHRDVLSLESRREALRSKLEGERAALDHRIARLGS